MSDELLATDVTELIGLSVDFVESMLAEFAVWERAGEICDFLKLVAFITPVSLAVSLRTLVLEVKELELTEVELAFLLPKILPLTVNGSFVVQGSALALIAPGIVPSD